MRGIPSSTVRRFVVDGDFEEGEASGMRLGALIACTKINRLPTRLLPALRAQRLPGLILDEDVGRKVVVRHQVGRFAAHVPQGCEQPRATGGASRSTYRLT